jgi:flap endonuclease-1
VGVKIKNLLEIHNIIFEDLRGKLVSIDAANALYQFLAIVQPTTGTPLMDNKQRVTSHLSGLFYRTINLVEKDIQPIYVFDGKPPKFKTKTIEGRREERENAYEQWKAAIEVGDVETARRFGQSAHRLTREMVEESKKLLDAMGIPIVQAPTEGEAQASSMVGKKNIYAVASQDFDSILFGAPRLVRNLSISETRRIPKTDQKIKVEPELIISSESFEKLKISREQLIDIAILIGTDFNNGVKGIGAKTALKLIVEYKDLKTAIKEKSLQFEESEEELQEIKNFFLQPQVVEDFTVEFKSPIRNAIQKILIDEHQFDPDRVDKGLKRLEKGLSKKQQMKLEKWFK